MHVYCRVCRWRTYHSAKHATLGAIIQHECACIRTAQAFPDKGSSLCLCVRPTVRQMKDTLVFIVLGSLARMWLLTFECTVDAAQVYSSKPATA